MMEEYSWESLAGRGQIPAIITIHTDRYGEINKTCNSNHFINFHEGARIVFVAEYVNTNSEITENMTALVDVQKKFELLFKGYFLEVCSDINPTIQEGVLCTCIVRKCKVEDLAVSNDYTLVRDKMDVVENIRRQVKELQEHQLEDVRRLNQLTKKLHGMRDYADELKLDQEHKEQYFQKIRELNSDIQELEIRLKKDIPELDKNLDINNFK